MCSYPRLSTRIHQALEYGTLDDISYTQSYTLGYLSKYIEQTWPQGNEESGFSFKRSDFGSGEHVSIAYKAFLVDSNEFSDAGEQDTCKVLYNLLTSKKPYRDQHQAVIAHFGSYAATATASRNKVEIKNIDTASASKARRDAIERLHAAAGVLSASKAGNATGIISGRGAGSIGETLSCTNVNEPPPPHHPLFAQALRIPFQPFSSPHSRVLGVSGAYFEDESDGSWTDEESPAAALATSQPGVAGAGQDSVEKVSAVGAAVAPMSTMKSSADASWLLTLCAEHLHVVTTTHTAQVYELAQQIHSLCCTEHAAAVAVGSRTDELPGVQDALFNLLGEEGFELMIQVCMSVFGRS